jgi:hypothetical protein
MWKKEIVYVNKTRKLSKRGQNMHTQKKRLLCYYRTRAVTQVTNATEKVF